MIKVSGEQVVDLPTDLYIPPDAMRVILDIFEGPLDLLLYLIRRQNLNILDISVATISKQYVEYIELMHDLHLELAAEYLEMAAILAEIKSRMLLPKPANDSEEEADPRKELIKRLQEYEQIKKAAENIDTMPRLERDIFVANALLPEFETKKTYPECNLKEILLAFKDVLKRSNLQVSHNIEREVLSVRDKMKIILQDLQDDKFVDFVGFFNFKEGRLGIVVTFLAILELIKDSILESVQSEPFAPIYVRLKQC